jgi:hypothetical protein
VIGAVVDTLVAVGQNVVSAVMANVEERLIRIVKRGTT